MDLDDDFLDLGPRARDRMRGILYPAEVGGMQVTLEFVPMTLASMGIPVEPETVRQRFIAELEADIESRRYLPPSDEDFALITDQARLEALCEDFRAQYGDGQAFAQPMSEAESRSLVRSYSARLLDLPEAAELVASAPRFN